MRRRIIGLAGIGLLSGLLTNVVDPLLLRATHSEIIRSLARELNVGGVFGVLVAVYFISRDGLRSTWRGVIFVAASAAAYLIAMAAATFVFVSAARGSGSMSSGIEIPLQVPFFSGAIGAILVVFASLFLFGEMEPGSSWFKKAQLGSLAGAVLGMIGWAAGSTFGHQLLVAAYALHLRPAGMTLETDLAQNAPQFFSLYVIWQTGIAAMIGYATLREAAVSADSATPADQLDRSPTKPRSRLATALGGIVVASLLAYFALQVTRTVVAEKAAARRMEAYHKARAEAPPTQNLPPVEPRGINDTLVIEDIGGLYVQKPMVMPVRASFESDLKTYQYSVAYVPNKNAPFGSYQPMVRAFVDQYPNADWAHYRTKYPTTFNPALDEPKLLSTVTKFGQRIVMNTMMRGKDGSGNLYFLWPSGNLVVMISYEMPEVNEDFIRSYLEKHPSSW